MPGVVILPRQQLHLPGAPPLKDRIIDDKRISALLAGQRLDGFRDQPGAEQGDKALPVDVERVLQTISGIASKISAFSVTVHVQIYTAAAEHQTEQVHHDHHHLDSGVFVRIAFAQEAANLIAFKKWFTR